MKKIITGIKIFFGFILAALAGFLFAFFKKSKPSKTTNKQLNKDIEKIKEKLNNDNKKINDLINTPDTERSEWL